MTAVRMMLCVRQSHHESCEQRRHVVAMLLVNNCDHHCEVDSRCAALDSALSHLVDNGMFSQKLHRATLQHYSTELQAVLKRITLGLY